MLDFHEVNCEVKIRENIVQIWETIKKQRSVSSYHYEGGLLRE